MNYKHPCIVGLDITNGLLITETVMKEVFRDKSIEIFIFDFCPLCGKEIKHATKRKTYNNKGN